MRDIVSLVEDESLQVTETGCQVGVRLKWYRSLPLSCIEKIQVSLDGQPVDPSLIRLSVDGHSYRMEEFPDLVEVFWFIQDSAILSIQKADLVKRGESHTLDVEMTVRFPYIAIGPGRFLTHVNHYSTEQVAR